MSETQIKHLVLMAFLGGDTLPPDYLDNDDRKIWMRVVSQIESAGF